MTVVGTPTERVLEPAASGVPAPSVAEDTVFSGRGARALGRIRSVVAVYVASRVLTFGAMAVAAAVTHRSLADVVYRWDSRWFMRVATLGYPSHLPIAHGHVAGNTIAFLPLFPLTFLGLSNATGLPMLAAGTLVSALGGLGAVAAVWALVRAYAGEGAAGKAAVLVSFFPGTFVFSLAYSDSLVVMFVALSLLALLRRRWLLAGVLGLLATATSPMALALEAAVLWAAVVVIRRERDWRALAAPFLVPVGFAAYQLWLWAHTGTLSAWRLTEQGGWRSYPSLLFPVRLVARFVPDPLSGTATQNILLLGTALTVACAVLAWRARMPPPVLVYGLSAAVLALCSAPVGLRPRFILLAFPLVAALAVRLRGRAYPLVIGASALLLVVATWEAANSWAIFP